MKQNKGIIGLGLIVAIVLGIVVVGGGAYYLSKGKVENKEIKEDINIEKKAENNNEEKINTEKSVSQNTTKTQINKNAGYQVDYPLNWYVKSSDIEIHSNGIYGFNSFIIQNTKDAVLPGSDFSLKTNGTYIDINVDTNINYSNYEEFIKDPKTDLPQSAKDERIKNLQMINIGGKSLQGLNNFKDSNTGGSYVFIYNKKQYSISIDSGSAEQFLKDKKVFDSMVSSFKFLDSEEPSLEVFNHQPGAIKSVKSEGANKWVFAVDLLSSNPNWLPGVNDRYLNQNTKIRNLNVTSSTKTYGCVSGPDGGGPNLSTVPNTNTAKYVSDVQKNITEAKSGIKYRVGGKEVMTDWETLSFDINGSNITAIYNICLP